MRLLIVDTVLNAPYHEIYENACKKNNIDYNFFVWDRDSTRNTELIGKKYIFHKTCPFGGSKYKKIYPMICYRRALLKLIKRQGYTHLILIDSLAPVMISKLVLSKFNGKYILDVRDYTYERFHFYKEKMDQLISHSAFTAISSLGFLEFLNQSDKIIISHNLSNEKLVCSYPTLNKNSNITVGFVGSIRYETENMKLLRAFANQKKFQFMYFGSTVADCHIKEKCEMEKITNVHFAGKYKNQDKPDIYKNIDIINSIYGTFSPEVTTAVPNRYYDALIFKKPILTSRGTYLGSLVEKKEIGLSLDLDNDNIMQIVNTYIKNFNSQIFVDRCNEELRRVVSEQENYVDHINHFLKDC